MEAHHPHHVTHKKKWNEYLLEFFMLFLAVFLGFIAENIRENSVERHREMEYLSSLLQDLKDDQKLLEAQIARHKNLMAMTDSFIAILNTPVLIPKSGDELYYFGRLAPRIGNFTANMRTYEQLKNSGNFRLIADAETSSKIMSYYQKIPQIHQLEDIFSSEFAEYKRVAAQVFEPVVFEKQNEGNTVTRMIGNPQLQTTDPHVLKQLAIYAIYMNGSRQTILVYDERLLQVANELINFLNHKYHLP